MVLPESAPHKTIEVAATYQQTPVFGPGRPIALTTKGEIMAIRIQSTERYLSYSFFAKVFATLEKWRLSVDLMSTSEVQVSMALCSKAPQMVGDTGDSDEIINHDLHGAIQDLRSHGRVELLSNMAILSIIGRQAHRAVGFAGNVLETIGRNNIHVEMISQGAFNAIVQSADLKTLRTLDRLLICS